MLPGDCYGAHAIAAARPAQGCATHIVRLVWATPKTCPNRVDMTARLGHGAPSLFEATALPRRAKTWGQVAEWLKAADCKSARASVRWFESSPVHHFQILRHPQAPRKMQALRRRRPQVRTSATDHFALALFVWAWAWAVSRPVAVRIAGPNSLTAREKSKSNYNVPATHRTRTLRCPVNSCNQGVT